MGDGRLREVQCHDTLSQGTAQLLACQPTLHSGGALLAGELAAELILLAATAKTLWSAGRLFRGAFFRGSSGGHWRKTG